MGSKRKSSSSALKKKRRSLERSKKKSKVGSRKSKKAYRRDNSDSFSDDDSSYSSYSSSDDSSVSRSGSDIRRRRSRSRSRKDRKKRSGRRRSLTRESNELPERVRKRKRSRKSGDTIKKRTKISKKKRRREPSVSSSSRSKSCSACKSSEDSETERIERLSRKVKVGEDPGAFRNVRNSRGMSRSCSPASKDDEYSQSVETNPRRLRSIIVFTRRGDEEVQDRFNDNDEHKDEIMYDHDGYPSSKSNDSNDEESRKEVFEETSMVPTRTNGLMALMDGSQNGNGIELHAVDASSNAEDLEANLRQRALENLKKFRGAPQKSLKKLVPVKADCEAKVKLLSSVPNQDKESIEQTKKEMWNVIHDTSATEKKVNLSPPNVEGVVDSYPSSEHGADVVNGNNNDTIDYSVDKLRQDTSPLKKPRLLECSGISTSISAESKGISENLHSLSNDSKLTSDNPSEIADASLDPVNNKGTRASKLDKAHLGIDHNSTVPDMLTSQVSEKNDEISNSITDQLNRIADDAEKSKPIVCTSENHNVEGQSSNQRENESRDGSQFQQKTMSVMRGGEMVQVSYKVYIPKKAPALARRKLKR